VLYGQEFKASLSHNKVAINQNFKITFEINGSGSRFSAPDFSMFQVLGGPNQSSKVSYVNGKMTQSKSFSYTLRPRASGTFSIGKASILCNGKNLSTQTLNIAVSKEKVKQQQTQQNTHDPFGRRQNKTNASTNQVNVGDGIHLVLNVSRSSLYQGEQLLAVYKIYFDKQIQINDYNMMPKFKGFWSQEIKVPDNNVKRDKYKGKVCNSAVLKKVLLTPQKSGKLVIDKMGIDMTVQVQTRNSGWGFFNSYRNVTLKETSNKIIANVKQLPKNKPQDFNGAVGSFSISSKLNKTETKANEAVSLNIKVKGTGNLNLFSMPKLDMPSDIETYDPKLTESIKVSGNRNTGYKSFEYLLIPRFAGEYKISPLSFSYFDPSKKKYITLKTQAYNLLVSGGEEKSESRASYSYNSKEEVSLLGKDILYIKKKSGFKKKESALFGSGLFYSLILIPLTLLIAFIVLLNKQRAMSSNKALLRRSKAGKLAKKHLKKASKYLKEDKSILFYDALSKGVIGYIGNKFNIDLSDASKGNIKKVLTEHKVDEETLIEIISFIELSDLIRYAPATINEPMSDTLLKAGNIIEKIEKA
ncbi:MAG TPA: protein BatD, partial [Bacteroidetes bacterium]|nr:protein BatD [Bacteroidota bacterium]